MKFITRLFFPTFLIMVIYGCPYESAVPLNDPEIKLLPELLGVWEDPKETTTGIYLVRPFNDFTYKIEHTFSDSSQKPEKFLGHLSLIDSSLFLNLKKVDYFPEAGSKEEINTTEKPKYYLYKLIQKGGLLTLFEVSDRIREKFNTNKEIYAFFKQHHTKSYFFNKEKILLINKYLIEKTTRQNIELTKNSEIQQIKLKESRTLNLVLYISISFLVVTLAFLWFYFRSRYLTNKLVAEKKQISAMLDGQEAERRRIALDLHDRLGSMLATVKLYFSTVEENLNQLQKVNQEQYSKASHLLDEACDEVRKISHDLISGDIVQSGLVSALHNLQETLHKTNRIQVILSTFGMENRLDPHLEITLFRIVQELVTNVLKHAHAEKLTIQLTKTKDNLNLILEDNGKGFDKTKQKAVKGIGLNNISKRLSEYGGTINIDSKPNKGTSVIIDIPMK